MTIKNLPGRIVIQGIRYYQTYYSPYRMPCCRFEPSCSSYAMTAFSNHNFITACVYSLVRLLRCSPWSKGGQDDVPATGLLQTITNYWAHRSLHLVKKVK